MKKELKRLWGGMLLLTWLVMCMPQVVSATEADAGEYGGDVSTSGIEFDYTDGSMPTVKSYYDAGEGTITWTPAPTDSEGNVTGAAVLTLDNATITATGTNNRAIRIKSNTDVVVEVIGDNTLKAESVSVLEFEEESPSNGNCIFTIKGSGVLNLEFTGDESQGTLVVYGDLKVTNVTLMTKANMQLYIAEDIYVYRDMEVENATISCSNIAVDGYYQKSGTVNCSGEVYCSYVEVGKDATLNSLTIDLYSMEDVAIEGTVNSMITVWAGDGNALAAKVVGDYVMDAIWQNTFEAPDITIIMDVPEGTTLIVPEGVELNLSGSNTTYSIEGTLKVNGTVTLPPSTTAEDIANLPITGNGAVKVETTEGTEQIYTTGGTELNAVAGLDFTNVGDGDGQTPAQGTCYLWDAATKTLTLNCAYISGALNLPAGSKIILNGASVVTGDITVAGAVSDAFTLSGEGTLASVDGKKYVSHAYDEPTFIWTETAGGYTAKAVFTCQGGEDSKTVDATVTATTIEATYTSEGKVVYKAKVTFHGKDYTESKEVVIPKIGLLGVEIEDAKSKAIYRVTSVTASGGTVVYVKHKSRSVKTVTIPKTITMDKLTFKVTGIAANAFKGCKKLTKVTIGGNVKTIGKEAFSGCKKLNVVKLGKNVTTIGVKAFYKCTALTSITIPSKVSKIEKSAFEKCKKLKKITIKTKKLTTKKVAAKAFKGIRSDAIIKVPKEKFKAYKALLIKKGVSKKATFKKN